MYLAALLNLQITCLALHSALLFSSVSVSYSAVC